MKHQLIVSIVVQKVQTIRAVEGKYRSPFDQRRSRHVTEFNCCCVASHQTIFTLHRRYLQNNLLLGWVCIGFVIFRDSCVGEIVYHNAAICSILSFTIGLRILLFVGLLLTIFIFCSIVLFILLLRTIDCILLRTAIFGAVLGIRSGKVQSNPF